MESERGRERGEEREGERGSDVECVCVCKRERVCVTLMRIN